MDANDWSIDGDNAELERKIPTKPEILTISAPLKAEIMNAVEEEKTNYFRAGFFGSRPEPSEVQVVDISTDYSPYLIVIGRYVAKFLRNNNYEWKVNSDVVTVKIDKDILSAEKKSFKMSNLVAKGVSGLSVGGVLSLAPFEDTVQKGLSKAFDKHDMTLLGERKICISVLEHALCDSKDKTLCYDASTASIVESSNILKQIEGAKTKDGRPPKCKEALDFRKAISDAEKKIVKIPESRVLEHSFVVSALTLVFLPRVYVKLKYRNEKKEFVLDGVSLEVLET